MSSLIPSFNNPPAYMGFVGFLRFRFASGPQIVRATSSDIKVTQAIEAPDIVDGRYDRTVYQLGPFETGGSAEFPAIYGRVSAGVDCNLSPAGALLGYAAIRDDSNGQLYPMEVDIKYTSENAQFTYKNNIINEYTLACAQSDRVNITITVIGTHREELLGSNQLLTDADTPVTRVVTWNDAFFEIYLDATGNDPILDGKVIRSFEVRLNNNAERYYTLNGSLYAQAIAPRKRDITGNMVLMGRRAEISERAFTNKDRCYENGRLRFGYGISAEGCCGNLDVTLPNVVYQIEDIALTNDLFETTVEWRSLPDNQEQLVEEMHGVWDPQEGRVRE